MKQETKLIKKLLYDSFPYARFTVRYSKTNNYALSSDKLFVNTFDVDIDTVIKNIQQNIVGIKVYKSGEMAMVSNINNEPKIYVNNEWYDADMLEFIEVRKCGFGKI